MDQYQTLACRLFMYSNNLYMKVRTSRYDGPVLLSLGVSEVDSEPDVQVIHAGTKLEGDTLVTSGGRVLAVVVKGTDLQETADRATKLAGRITFEGATFRRDVAARATTRSAD